MILKEYFEKPKGIEFWTAFWWTIMTAAFVSMFGPDSKLIQVYWVFCALLWSAVLIGEHVTEKKTRKLVDEVVSLIRKHPLDWERDEFRLVHKHYGIGIWVCSGLSFIQIEKMQKLEYSKAWIGEEKIYCNIRAKISLWLACRWWDKRFKPKTKKPSIDSHVMDLRNRYLKNPKAVPIEKNKNVH